MTITFFNDPKVGPRWNGLGEFMQHVPPDKRQDTIDRFCMTYPTWFFEWMTEVDGNRTQLEAFQIDYLLDDSRLKITNKTRQAGGSLVVSMAKFWKAYTTYGYRCDVVSVNRAEAQGKIRYIKDLYLSLPKRWQQGELAYDNLERIGFHKGQKISEIRSVAASAGVRGGRKDVVFDEAAHIEGMEDLFVAALPAIARSRKGAELGFDIISTPNGQQGKFYEIYNNVNGDYRDWSRHQFCWWDVSFFATDIFAARKRWEDDYGQNPEMLLALRDEFGTDKFKQTTSSLTTEQYHQEFCGIFVDESTAFYTYALIDSVRRHSAPQREGDTEGTDYIEFWTRRPDGNDQEVTMGIDFAEGRIGGDSTSIQVLEKGEDGIHRHRFYEDLDHRNGYDSFDKQIVRIGELIELLRPTTVRVDETGLGRRIAAELKEKFSGITTIDPVTFTNQNKEEMALNLKAMMERQTLLLQWDNDNLKAQIHNVKRRITAAGNIQYEGKPHDDMFWALALAARGGNRGGFRIITIFD